MKQKRKVKNLIPCKNKDEKLLTILLLVLSVVLCLGSASLMTFSVGAASDDENFFMPYTGYDATAEVLYELEFSDPNALWDDESLDRFYMEANSLYLTPSEMRVETNTGDSDNYVNILGGESNEVYSDNITIVAGYNNTIEEGNDNASILGGDSNAITGNSQKVPAVIVGGKLNKVTDNDGDTILGGSENIILGSSNSTILGGESNEVEKGKNVIIGGTKVKVGDIENVFAFSDSDFQPESSGAFYLNLVNGVGLSTNSEKKGVAVSGTVGFGNIDIENVACLDENIGVEGAWNGCLVGCTEESRDVGKWELLDRGSRCEEICNNDYCMYRVYTGLQEVPDYTGFCLTDHIDVSNATRCTTGENESYEDVVFESTLIDYETECPVTGNNKCVYRCNPEAHLTGDMAGGTNAVMCYKDCELPWDHTKRIKHNETVVGYNIEDVNCSNDIYVFPLETEIINKPLNIYTVGNKTVNGTIYKNRDKNGKSAETCGNYDHKKTLVCLSGSLYLLNSGGMADVSTKAEAEAYKYESCNLHDYRCDTGVYSLVQQQIVENKEDAPKNGNRVVADRGTLTGERGIYKLCIDYNADPTNPTVNGESCLTGTTSYHYQFSKCQSGYDLQPDAVCRKRCTLVGINGSSSGYTHGTILNGYQATGAICTGTCQSQQIACNDGVWKLGGLDGEENTDYLYNDCELKNRVCTTDYNVNESIKAESGQYSIYDSCDPYDASGKFECVKKDTVYKLVGCEEGYHTENNLYCVPNQKEEDCGKIAGKYDGNGSYQDAKVDIYWEGEWNTGHWTTPSECKWECDTSYHLSGFVCVSDTRMVNCRVPAGQKYFNYNIGLVAIYWENGGWTTPERCKCIDGYIQDGDSCVSSFVCTGSIPLDAYFITGSDEDLIEDVVRKAYKDDELENKKCAYACNTGFLAYEGICYPCEYGELDEQGRCINSLVCPDDKPYFYNGECYAELGACKNNESLYNLNNLSNVIEKIGIIEPINPTDVLDMKCVDADMPNWGNVEKNSCTYSCKEGYYCNSNNMCQKPYCKFDSWAGEAGYYYTGGIPSHHNFGDTYCRIDDADFLDYPVTVSGFLDKYGMRVGVDGSCGGCYFWCPEQYRFYYETDPDRFKCLNPNHYKNCDNAGSDVVDRRKENTYFNLWMGNPETREEKRWKYYDTTADYNAAINRGETCIRNCKGQTPITGYQLASPGNKNLFQAKKGDLYCYKKCGSNQYYSGDGKCYNCPSDKILTGLAKTVINGITYSEYRLCIDDCQAPLVWNATYGCIKNCGAGLQWSGSVGDCVSKCSAGEEWSITQNKCVSKCSAGEEWSTTQNKCVSKCSIASGFVWSESMGTCVSVCPISATWDGYRCVSNPVPAGCPNSGEIKCGGECISCRPGQKVDTSDCSCVDA